MSKNSKTVVAKPVKKVATKAAAKPAAEKSAAKTVKAPAKKAAPKAEKPAKGLCCWYVQQLDCRCRHAQEGQEDGSLGCKDFPRSGRLRIQVCL